MAKEALKKQIDKSTKTEFDSVILYNYDFSIYRYHYGV